MRAILTLLLSLAALTSACRLNPECFGQNECDFGLVCYEGRCREGVPDGGVITSRYTWHRDVQPIVETYCISCHGAVPTNGAPMSLVTYQDVTNVDTTGARIYDRMAARVGDPRIPMPPAGNPMPSQAESEIIDFWAAEGAPEGTPPGRDAGPRDGGPIRDGGPPRDGGPVNPIPLMQNPPDQLAFGYTQAEGPLWRDQQGDLLFVDVPGDVILRFVPGILGATPFVQNLMAPAALRFDTDGNILVTEGEARYISIIRGAAAPAPYIETFDGMRFNGPNDMAVRMDGTIYFTDPAVYTLGNPPVGSETGVTALYRRAPDGTVFQEATYDIGATPNGLELNLDESVLFMTITNAGELRRFDVEPDGSLTNEMLMDTGLGFADGMIHDGAGNLYLGFQDGIVVYDPTGARWGVYAVPQAVSNMTFGGPLRDTLYITTGNALLSTPVGVRGTTLR